MGQQGLCGFTTKQEVGGGKTNKQTKTENKRNSKNAYMTKMKFFSMNYFIVYAHVSICLPSYFESKQGKTFPSALVLEG